ncbi:hypothetical protein D8S78_07515 [Natrialba swarupiae]|nr:hypothetical protein [Natrialba swarupiae]
MDRQSRTAPAIPGRNRLHRDGFTRRVRFRHGPGRSRPVGVARLPGANPASGGVAPEPTRGIAESKAFADPSSITSSFEEQLTEAFGLPDDLEADRSAASPT